jgi:dTDP-4-amino-4,6-dideoxygalactose transaminase
MPTLDIKINHIEYSLELKKRNQVFDLYSYLFSYKNLVERSNLGISVYNNKDLIGYILPCRNIEEIISVEIKNEVILFFEASGSESNILILTNNLGLEIGYFLLEYQTEINCVNFKKMTISELKNIESLRFYLEAFELFAEIELLAKEILVEVLPGEEIRRNFLTNENYFQIDKSNILSKNLVLTRKKADKILTAGPSISQVETILVNEAVRNGWNNSHSDYINKFEGEFANFVGSKFAMATSSCTGALHLSLLALGIKEGDEVIVPEVTWVATASAVRYVGATPVFADIDPLTWTISLQSIKNLVTEKTKAIIPVHLYGYAANLIEISDFAKSRGIFVVEDAAPAIGTKIGNNFAGAIGDIGCYSFQGAKMLVTGEGGMLVTNNEELYRKVKKIQDHGRKSGTFWIEELGYKYKMSNIQAALGLAQLYRVDNLIYRKRRINSWYRDGLKNITGITFQENLVGTESICWMTSIKIGNSISISRDKVMNQLLEKGIDSRPVFPAISQYPFWNEKNSPKPIAKEIGDRAINLPSGVNLSKNSIDFVISSLYEILT